MLILQRVPSNILSSMQLLLSRIFFHYPPESYTTNLVTFCNEVGISERFFRDIYHHLRAVMSLHEFPSPTLDETIDLERSFFDQNLPSTSRLRHLQTLPRIYGAIAFHHKSFYEFLRDPARSSSFSIITPAIRQNLFDRLIQQHHHYASSYVTQGTKLILRPGIASSSTTLSWPQGSEYVDSWAKALVLLNISSSLSYGQPGFRIFLEGLLASSLQKLTELDYRKYMLGSIMLYGTGVFRTIEGSQFNQIKDYADFDPEALERTRIIRPCHPRLGSSRAIFAFYAVPRRKPSGKKFGLYKFGQGDKSMIWYWEFDKEKRYFREFQTVNYEEAMAFYRAGKSTMWDLDEDEDGSNVEDKDVTQEWQRDNEVQPLVDVEIPSETVGV
ncbi:hypothetical protein D9756_006441 [Leucocoprinus leucothites]|uniref:Uncharacterized protein n=1 Tax=Leucocoprinus leucothites TaxID=201217 RepID=A0A8H5G204_9AGAR|nr:hypothetical protein D9756_006441 [Leucoagaricus leucothites]